MEKINSEELKNLPGGYPLSDDELEKASGGEKAPVEGKKYADSDIPAAVKPTIRWS